MTLWRCEKGGDKLLQVREGKEGRRVRGKVREEG